MASKEQIENLRARRDAIRNGQADTVQLNPEEQKILDESDLDNAEVQELIMNPNMIQYQMENGTMITLHKMSAYQTRKFFGFCQTVAGAVITKERAISGIGSGDNFVTGLHIKGLLVQSDELFNGLVTFIVYASAPMGTLDERQVPKIAKEFVDSLTMEDTFNCYALICQLTGVTKVKSTIVKNDSAPQPEPATV